MNKQKRFKASLLALALAVLPWSVEAAGLGRLTVVSALGQPLRAEIDLTVSREEYSSLTAKLASGDAFKNAGIEFSPALSGIRFKLDRRANGQAYLLATSDKSFNEPFVDMLVEVTWASGRLVREYTFLLDPPEIFKSPATPAVVILPEAKVPAAAPVVVPPQIDAPAAATKAPEPAAAAPAPVSPAPAKPAMEKATPAKTAPTPPKAAEPGTGAERKVKSGDTLAKIANEVKPEGVNLDQMLVALFRSNKDAFDAGNMNRLRAGKILNIPDKEAATAVETGEARKVVVAQAADFNAYRKRLAGMVAAEPGKAEAPKQAVTGKITPRVEDKVPAPVVGKDKLEVSRSETGKATGKSGDRIAAVEEELIARDKALKEAKGRIQDLEKNLNDLRRLAEMKGAAGAKPAEPVAAPKPAEAAKPLPVPTVPATPVEAPKPPAPPTEKKPLPPPPPAPPPSFVEENPEMVFGGGAVLALLLGYLGYGAWRRKRQAAAELDNDRGDDSFAAAKSEFASTGALSVDTNAVAATDFDQESVAGAGSDEGVDPVAEADVYIAYGRDTQAEEILLEALKTEPTRCAIHLKLLEIYAARKNVQAFEAVAQELRGLTGGSGPDWEKAAALGLTIDSQNPLYGGAPAQPAADDFAEASMATQVMSAPVVEAPVTEEAAATEPAPVEEGSTALDFDLDLGSEPEAEAAPAAEQPAAEEVMSLDFDLDLGAEPVAEVAAELAAETAAPELDIDLGAPAVEVEAEVPPPEAPPAEPKADEVAALDFDFDLGDKDATPAAVAEPEMPALNLSDISLELDAPAAPVPEAPVEVTPALELPVEEAPVVEAPVVEIPALEIPPSVPEPAPVSAPAPAVVEDDPEVATKLELALAYEEMGDKEGARELLNEVLKEGSPAQQEAARNKLAELG